MVHFCERLGLRHRRQVVDAELEAELLQVLMDEEGRVGQWPFNGAGRASDRVRLQSYLRLVFDGGREQHDGVVLGDAPLDGLLAQPLQPRLSVERGQVQQACGRESEGEALQSAAAAAEPAAHALTNGVLWWQVDRVCVEILQECSVHQIRELMDLDGVLVHFVQQRAEMLTPRQQDIIWRKND